MFNIWKKLWNNESQRGSYLGIAVYFVPRANRALKIIADSWNNHLLSSEKSLFSEQLWMLWMNLGGQNRPTFFFQNFALKKTALVIQILRVCWSIIERQNCYNKPTQSFTYYLFIPSISIKQTKYRLSLLWWISSRRSIDIGMKENRLLFNCMFNREGCEEQCQIKLKLYFLVERTM